MILLIILFLQNFLQDFFNCQIIRGFFTRRLPRHASSAQLSPRSLPVNLSRSADPDQIWWAYLDLNQGPRPYQGRALTS